jgi:hypothetical protein
MPTGNPEGYCGCCGEPCINGYTKHNNECMWDDADEFNAMEAKYLAQKLKEKENNDRL